jgi:hypothetical protein
MRQDKMERIVAQQLQMRVGDLEEVGGDKADLELAPKPKRPFLDEAMDSIIDRDITLGSWT